MRSMADPSDPARAAEPRPGAPWGEVLQAVVPVVALAVIAVVTQDRPRFGGLAPTLLLVIAPLTLRRLLPLAVFVVVALGALATAAESPVPWVQVLAVGLASYTAGDLARDRTTSALVTVAIAVVMTAGFVAQGAEPLQGLVLPSVALVPTWLLGDTVRARRMEAVRRAEAVERTLREQEERLRAAAAEERRHVARELHDVVAHAVSVMVIQAGAARQVVRTSPAQAEESLLAVEATGRSAMTELRRFLGALSEPDEAAGLTPQPGIGQLPALLDRVREAGLPASLEVAGAPRAVPPSMDVTVYRIVQEALTNALRYARQAATLVRLSWEPDQLRVEVLDEGPAAAGASGTGRGLVGMRERAALAGGRLEAGPRLGGGYAVRAWLPLAGGGSLDTDVS
jgi:signal transduction histidine kinase